MTNKKKANKLPNLRITLMKLLGYISSENGADASAEIYDDLKALEDKYREKYPKYAK